MQESDMITFAAEADDVGKRIDGVTPMVLAHRLILTYEAKMEKISSHQIIDDILESLGEIEFKV